MTLRAAFHPLDWAILGLYFVFLLAVGFWPRRESTEDYLIAGRSLSLPVFVATLVATWYGGILGVGEFVYNSGVVTWTTNGLPYYVFALLFAVFLARRVRGGSANVYTIPDKLAQAYDSKTALLGAAFAFVYAAPSAYVLMAGTLLHVLFGWPLLPAMLAGIAFSVVYVFRGGFLADVRVNTLQFGLMFLGFGAVTALCLAKFGGTAFLLAPGRLPPDHLKLDGGMGTGYVVVWFFIALVTLTDPGFHQRCYAAKTPRVAALGIGLAVLCWMTFDALSTTTGLFARALLPNLADAKLAFPALAERVLPPGWKGLFYVGMLAPIMASTVSYTFIAAMTVGRDFHVASAGRGDDGPRPGLHALGAGADVRAGPGDRPRRPLRRPPVVRLRQRVRAGRAAAPAGRLRAGRPLARRRAISPSRPCWAGAGVALAWLLWGWGHGGYDDPAYPLDWQPMYPGLAVAALAYGAGLVVKKGGVSPALLRPSS